MANDKIILNAEDLLADVVDVFAAATVDLPDRQYIQFGEVAIDCDQLVVEYVGANRLNTGTQAPCSPYYEHTFRIWLLRCVPTIINNQPPTPDQLHTATEQLLTDADILLYQLPGHWKQNNTCDRTMIVTLAAYGPSGTMGGSVVTISRNLL